MPNILDILTDPNPLLRAKTSEVKNITPEVLALIEDMKITMHKKDGTGLAAPQVGSSLKIAVVENNSNDNDNHPAPLPLTVLINPKIISFGSIFEEQEEGCLSVPDKQLKILRSREINLIYFDVSGRRHRLRAKSMPARIIQHELDHLDGILITDRYAAQQKDRDAK